VSSSPPVRWNGPETLSAIGLPSQLLDAVEAQVERERDVTGVQRVAAEKDCESSFAGETFAAAVLSA